MLGGGIAEQKIFSACNDIAIGISETKSIGITCGKAQGVSIVFKLSSPYLTGFIGAGNLVPCGYFRCTGQVNMSAQVDVPCGSAKNAVVTWLSLGIEQSVATGGFGHKSKCCKTAAQGNLFLLQFRIGNMFKVEDTAGIGFGNHRYFIVLLQGQTEESAGIARGIDINSTRVAWSATHIFIVSGNRCIGSAQSVVTSPCPGKCTCGEILR